MNLMYCEFVSFSLIYRVSVNTIYFKGNIKSAIILFNHNIAFNLVFMYKICAMKLETIYSIYQLIFAKIIKVTVLDL